MLFFILLSVLQKIVELLPQSRNIDHYFLRGAFGKLIYTQQLCRRQGARIGRCTGMFTYVTKIILKSLLPGFGIMLSRFDSYIFPLGRARTVLGERWEKTTTGRWTQSICPDFEFRESNRRTVLKVHLGFRNNICCYASPKCNLREQWQQSIGMWVQLWSGIFFLSLGSLVNKKGGFTRSVICTPVKTEAFSSCFYWISLPPKKKKV